MNEPNKTDYAAIRRRFEQLGSGVQADLRRATDPYQDLPMRPAYYTLMGPQNHKNKLRIAFLIPWAEHREGGDTLGVAIAKAKISEKRLFQMIRSTAPNNLIQLRRLLQQINPKVDWNQLGKTLHYWNEISRRQLLEQYYQASANHHDE